MRIRLTTSILVLLFIFGCSKSEFLAQKPDLAMEVPSSLEDLRAILDDDNSLNGEDDEGCTPQLGESASDNIYLMDQNYVSNMRPQMQNYYVWKADPYDGVAVLDWIFPYRNILTVNTVLDVLSSNDYADVAQVRVLRGESLFHRAHMLFQLASVFAPIYYQGSNATERGIPLRLSSDINEAIRYSTVQETFAHIEAELLESADLLPESQLIKTRPSRAAAFALLSRLYLYTGNYPGALSYADSCLAIDRTLLDYNTLNASISFPFSSTGSHRHPEVLFSSNMLSGNAQSYPTRQLYARVDSLLYNSFAPGDLRKTVFFLNANPGQRFKGSYAGTSRHFAGLAIDEVYLNKAEAMVRLGDVAQGLAVLDELLRSRWSKGANYVPVPAAGQREAIAVVMQERRKELLFRGIRWMDLKRMIAEGESFVLRRVISGVEHTIGSGDGRWVWPIPPEVECFM